MLGTAQPRTKNLLIVGAAWLVAGCAAGPDYVRPDVSLRSAFMGPAAGASDAATAEGAWWATFNDSVLADLVAAAVAGNLDIDQSARASAPSPRWLASRGRFAWT